MAKANEHPICLSPRYACTEQKISADTDEVETMKKYLEDDIRKEYQLLQYVKMNFPHKQVQLKNNILFLHTQHLQAVADYAAFQKV